MLDRTAAAALLLALAASQVAAQAPFYQGKQLKVLVGFPPGGGSDLFARVIADGLARHAETVRKFDLCVETSVHPRTPDSSTERFAFVNQFFRCL